jgi:hypothetical protein
MNYIFCERKKGERKNGKTEKESTLSCFFEKKNEQLVVYTIFSFFSSSSKKKGKKGK